MNGPTDSRTSTISLLLGVWALFLGFALLQVGTGLQRILLPIRGESEGMGAGAMGVVMLFFAYILGNGNLF